ncbi:protein valois [Contarinia nasturtii]|uniref:protein valois n=1 Tax=Contarinia nasturtii TaxID=265458 RepID=UPI0012D3E363|nr:protein valois [Contarinia nasturtii]
MNVDFSEYFKAPLDYNPPKDTELNGSTQFPNLNSVEFRNRQNDNETTLLPFYELVEANDDQSTVLLATNSYNQRLWNGSVFGYDCLSDVGKPNADRIKLSFDSNVTGIRFLDKSMVVFTNANGSIFLYSTQSEIRQKDGYSLFQVSKKTEHYGMITGLTILNGAKSAVTVSSDGCIKVWLLAPCDIVSDQTYQYAHKEVITGISKQPKSSDIFATCSRDRFLSIWDIRIRLPMINSWKNEDYANTSCLWANVNGIEKLYVGDDTGTVHIYDPRKLDTSVASQTLFDRPIFKFSQNPSENLVCVLSQSNKLKVLNTASDTNTFATVYEDYSSKDYVRDVCWVKGDKQQAQQSACYTVGWSKTIGHHTIEP